MFNLKINKSIIRVIEREPLASGASKIYSIAFSFDEEWNGLVKTAIFKAGKISVSVLIENDECQLPWEVLASENISEFLWIGVFGSDSEGVRLPTVWNQLGVIQPGAELCGSGRAPTPEVVALIYAAAKEAENKAEEACSRAANAQIYAEDAKKHAEKAETYLSETEQLAKNAANEALNASSSAESALASANQASLSAEETKKARDEAADYAGIAENFASQLRDIVVEAPADVQRIVRNGDAAKVFKLGDSFAVPLKSGGTAVFDIIGFDAIEALSFDGAYGEHSMLLQLHELYPVPGQYSAPEAYYVNPSALAAGNYYINTGNYGYFYFTLTEDIKAECQFVFPQNAFEVNETPTTVDIFEGYSSYDPMLTLTVLRAPTDGIEYTQLTDGLNSDANMCKYANGNYENSSLQIFLNGFLKADNKFSRPSEDYRYLTPFYNDIDDEFKSILGYHNAMYAEHSGGTPVFLLTADECDVEGGTALEYFMKKGSAIRYDAAGLPQVQWLRKTSSPISAQSDTVDKKGKVYRQNWTLGRAFIKNYFAPCVVVV